MPNRQRTTVELPAWTVSRGQTYLNEKVHGEGREDLEPLREKVAETTPSDGRLELDRGEYQTFQRVVRDGAERELQQLEGQEANILGDAEQQREAARKARQGVVNNPPEFGVTGRSADSPLFDGPVAPQATDIGRRASGRFDRTHREPDISTEPIAREQQTGRFQVDPFDITPGYEGAPPAGDAGGAIGLFEAAPDELPGGFEFAGGQTSDDGRVREARFARPEQDIPDAEREFIDVQEINGFFSLYEGFEGPGFGESDRTPVFSADSGDTREDVFDAAATVAQQRGMAGEQESSSGAGLGANIGTLSSEQGRSEAADTGGRVMTDGSENPFGDSSRRSGSSHHEEESNHGRY